MTEHHPFLKELQQRADRAHKSVDRADDAPPEIWQRVRSQVNTKEEESPTMSTITMPANPASLSQPAAPMKSRGIGHYANLVATIAIVIGIAVAGWFATMQLNHPGNDGGRFAFVGSTPVAEQSIVCDVEPLTVDEVMEIIRNPYRYMFERSDPNSNALDFYEFMARQELAVGFYFPSWDEFKRVNRTSPGNGDFEEAQAAVNTYIRCTREATNSQYWALLHPIAVQEQILASFPVFADEETVRAHVEEVIHEPVSEVSNRLSEFYSAYGDVSIIANPDSERADLILYASADYEPTIAMGVFVTDEDGQVIMETGSTGYPHQIMPGAITLRPVIVVQQSSATGEWYVLPYGT